MIGDEIDAIAAGLGELPAERRLLVELARRLAVVLDDADTAPYVLAGTSKELRATVAELCQVKDDSDDELKRFLESVSVPSFRGPGV